MPWSPSQPLNAPTSSGSRHQAIPFGTLSNDHQTATQATAGRHRQIHPLVRNQLGQHEVEVLRIPARGEGRDVHCGIEDFRLATVGPTDASSDKGGVGNKMTHPIGGIPVESTQPLCPTAMSPAAEQSTGPRSTEVVLRHIPKITRRTVTVADMRRPARHRESFDHGRIARKYPRYSPRQLHALNQMRMPRQKRPEPAPGAGPSLEGAGVQPSPTQQIRETTRRCHQCRHRRSGKQGSYRFENLFPPAMSHQPVVGQQRKLGAGLGHDRRLARPPARGQGASPPKAMGMAPFFPLAKWQKTCFVRSVNPRLRSLSSTMLFLACVLGALPASAQQTTNPSEPDRSAPPTPDILQRGIVEEVSASDLEFYGLNTERSFPVHLGLTVNSFYDNNIFISNTDEVDDWVWEIKPEVYYETGPLGESDHYFMVKYDPTLTYFTNTDGEDTFDNSGWLQYQFRGDKGSIGVTHHSFQTSGAERDIGNRSTRTVHETIIAGTLELGGKTSLESFLGQRLGFYDLQNDRHQWWGDAYLLYEVLPKLKIGFGPKIGFIDAQNTVNQSYQQLLGRVIYDPSEKLSINASFGLDYRQFQDPQGIDDQWTPAASIGAVWSPFDGTQLSAALYRNNETSTSITSSNFDVTGFVLRARQRFLQRFYLKLAGGYEYADYYGTTTTTTVSRTDDYFFARTALEYEFVEWFTASVFYEYQDNDSNTEVNDYHRNQAGVSLNFRY